MEGLISFPKFLGHFLEGFCCYLSFFLFWGGGEWGVFSTDFWDGPGKARGDNTFIGFFSSISIFRGFSIFYDKYYLLFMSHGKTVIIRWVK